MSDHPIEDCMKVARPLVAAGDAAVFQKFTCAKCGSRQTMSTPNAFYTHGTCEECGWLTDIRERGCNYMLHKASGPSALAQLQQVHGPFSSWLTLVDCTEHLDGFKQNEQ